MLKSQKDKKKILKYRLTLIVPYLITAIILAVLIILKKDDILVQIDVTVQKTSFEFVGSEGGPLFPSLQAKSARFVHFEKFDIPYSKLQLADKLVESYGQTLNWATVSTNSKLTVLPDEDGASIVFENIRLNELRVKKGARLELTATPGEAEMILTIDKFPTKGRILIGKQLLGECQYCNLEGITNLPGKDILFVHVFNDTSHEIDFQSKNDIILIGVAFAPDTKVSEKNIYVKAINFLQRRGQNLQTTLVKPGKITFKELGNKEYKIESHDFVKIIESETLQITKMTIDKSGIRLVLIGRVDEFKTGPKGFLSNRLPSFLEWIIKNNVIILFYNALVLGATTWIAIVQRLKLTSAQNDDSQK